MNDQPKAVFFDLCGTLLVFNNFDEANEKWTNAFYDFACKPHNISFKETKELCSYILESTVEKDAPKGFTTYETKIFNAFAQRNVLLSKMIYEELQI